MSRFLKRYFLLAVVLLLACFINLFILSGIRAVSFFNDIILYFLLGIYSILGILVICKDIKYYRKHLVRWVAFIPSFGLIILGLSFVGCKACVYQLDNSPVVFTAYGMQDFNGVYIEFREDQTYRITEYVLFSADYYRGTYTLKDSIITLQEKDEISKRGTISGCMFKFESKRDTATNTIYKKLVQIDDNFNKIKNSEVLSVRYQ